MASTRRAQRGGKKRGSRKASSWTKFVTQVYRELKAKRKDASLADAMKEASRRKGRK